MRLRCICLVIGIFSVFFAINCGNGILDKSKKTFISDTEIAKLCTPRTGTHSNITHLVLIVQENHSFDNIFGNYCKATTGSNPGCNSGPECCEAGPIKDPGSENTPLIQDDSRNLKRDPNHSQACQIKEMNGGKMDRYSTSEECGSPENFAYANENTAKTYWTFARNYALADRYFQPIAGASSSNNMYFARANFVFTDNDFSPKGALGTQCGGGNPDDYNDLNIGDMLRVCQIPFSVYAGGYSAMKATGGGSCPKRPVDCPAGTDSYPCNYDAGDIPFQYYSRLKDNPAIMKDLDDDFGAEIKAGTLPAVSYIKPSGYKSEHPGNSLSLGVSTVNEVVNQILNSPIYSTNTLILTTYDESGGFFDHITPPDESIIDHKPYGPRVPLIAIGYFAKKNFVSHVVMEHSSVVKFIEWNWFAGSTGQMGTRDTVVNNIGSLLDPKKTGQTVP